MSVVAVKIVKGGFEMPADSITVRGYTQEKGENTNHSKIFETNGLVIGGVGFAGETSLLRIYAETAKPKSATEYGIIEYMQEFNDWKYKKTNKWDFENSFLIGFRGKVFLFSYWHVSQITNFYAIGAGADYALAALHLGHSTEEAVNVAIELSVYCEAPVNTIKKTKEHKDE